MNYPKIKNTTVQVTAIFGQQATSDYHDTGKISEGEDIGGILEHHNFKTLAEYEAYCLGVNDSADWYDGVVLEPEIVEEDVHDCKYCEEWRQTFNSKQGNVYCPDCGKHILLTKKDR